MGLLNVVEMGNGRIYMRLRVATEDGDFSSLVGIIFKRLYYLSYIREVRYSAQRANDSG